MVLRCTMGFYPSLIISSELPSRLVSRLVCFIVSSIVNIVLTPTTKVHSHEISISFINDTPPCPERHLPAAFTAMPLPMELILSIIEYGDTSFLKQCSLVCRDWAGPSQRLLFQNVHLSSRNAFDSFRSAVDRSTEHGKFLADSTVKLQVALDSDQPNGLSVESFVHAVTSCPNLYELNLSLYGSRRGNRRPIFDDGTLSMLASIPLVSLHLNNFSDDKHATTQLLEVWPSLKFLSLSGTRPPVAPPSEYSPFSLRELHLNMPFSPSLNFTKWLLHNSTDLRCLSLSRVPCSEFLRYMLQMHSSSLQSLVLPSFAREHASAVEQCVNLRELIIENTRMSPNVYKKIHSMPHVEHIGFSIDVDTAMQPILDVVRSRPALKAITVQVAGPRHVLLPALQIACARNGVELKLTKDIRAFRAIIRGDPILSDVFPRVKSLRNLNTMRLR